METMIFRLRMSRARSDPSGVRDHQNVPVGVVNPEFSLRSIEGILNRTDRNAGLLEASSRARNAVAVQVEEDSLLAGDDRLAREREHQLRTAFGLEPCPRRVGPALGHERITDLE